MSPRHDAWNDEPPERPRILLECPPEHSPSIIASVVERHGMAVRVCSGPDVGAGCDLLTNGACSLAAEADVVVNMLGQHRESGRQVAAAVQAQRRAPAVVVELTALDRERPDVDTTDQIELERGFTTTALLDAIRRALAQQDARPPRWGV